MTTYKMPCRDLNALNPTAKKACELFLNKCKAAGLVIGVNETLRTAEYQNSLYQKGRTTAGSIVTNCDGYKNKSEHQDGWAFDFFQNIKGKEWEASFYDKACPIAKELGLDSGYYWKSFIDKPHVTVPKNWVEPKEEYKVTKTKIVLNGVTKEVDAINVDGTNYIKLRDIADKKIVVDYDSTKKMPVITSK